VHHLNLQRLVQTVDMLVSLYKMPLLLVVIVPLVAVLNLKLNLNYNALLLRSDLIALVDEKR
jgi:hypothetical protein